MTAFSIWLVPRKKIMHNIIILNIIIHDLYLILGDAQACVPIDPQPVLVQVTCAAVRCGPGHTCRMINGQANCVPRVQLPTQECPFPMECEPGTECRLIGGDAQACVPIDQPASCAAVLCEEGTTCEVVNGRATCVPKVPECRRLCPPSTVCKFIDGTAVCVY